MHISLRQPSNTINRFAKAHNIESKLVDGNDVVEIYRTASEFIRKMRLKPEPYLIEAITYRWFGHVDWRDDIDVGVARSKKDLLNWKKRDPIKRLSDAMINKRIWTIEKQLSLESKVEELIDENWEKAMKDDFPNRKSLLDNVYKYD
jgi:pyruvate dehydrogenase E1 component alpha subunit